MSLSENNKQKTYSFRKLLTIYRSKDGHIGFMLYTWCKATFLLHVDSSPLNITQTSAQFPHKFLEIRTTNQIRRCCKNGDSDWLIFRNFIWKLGPNTSLSKWVGGGGA